ncbi:MAG: SH3 domain-containing protein [Caldilineaceae bacterium]
MRRLWSFVAIASIAFHAHAELVTVESPRDGFLALRSEPSVKSGVRLAKIPHATALTLGECREAVDKRVWCRTSFQGKTGWIAKRYVVSRGATGEKAELGGGTWRIRPDGFGPVTFGMAQAEAEKLLGQKLEHNESWTDECFYSQVSLALGTASVQVKNHRVVVVAIGEFDRPSSHGRGIATSRGIRLGDALARVDSAYHQIPGLTRNMESGVDGDYPAVVYWDSGRNRGILFEYNPRSQRVMGVRAGTKSIYHRHEGCY